MPEAADAQSRKQLRTHLGMLLDGDTMAEAIEKIGPPPRSQDAWSTGGDTKWTAEKTVELLIAELGDEGRTHVDTVFACLGALSGFAAQMGLRESLLRTGKATEQQVFAVVETKSGETFYLGNTLNDLLFGDGTVKLSVLHVLRDAVRSLGAEVMPDHHELASRVAGTLGDEMFGIMRLPEEHQPQLPLVTLLNSFWNPVRNLLVIGGIEPLKRPAQLAHAAQYLMISARKVIRPELAARIFLEAAVPMSKIAPERVHRAYALAETPRRERPVSPQQRPTFGKRKRPPS